MPALLGLEMFPDDRLSPYIERLDEVWAAGKKTGRLLTGLGMWQR
jgi:hypothetical protein